MPVHPGNSTAVESVEKTSVCSKYGGDHDENILDPRDRATKALSCSTRVAATNSFARNGSTRLIIGKACAVV